MENRVVNCGKLKIGNLKTFTLIAGPCQLENEKHALSVAEALKRIREETIRRKLKSKKEWIRKRRCDFRRH